MVQKGHEEAVARVLVMSQVAEQMLEQAMQQVPPQAQAAVAHAQEKAAQAREHMVQHLAEAMQQAQQAQEQAQEHAQQAEERAQQAEEQAQEQAQEMMQNFQMASIKGQVESIDGQNWTVDGQVVVVPDDALVKGDVEVGDTVQIHGYVDPNGQMVAVQVQPSSIDAGSQADQTPANSQTNQPPMNMISFQGVVEAQSDEAWTVNGYIVAIDSDTKINGSAQVGDTVLVIAQTNEDGTLTGKMITQIARNGHDEDRGEGHEEGEGQGFPTELKPTMPSGSWDSMWSTAIPGSTDNDEHEGGHNGEQNGNH